MHTFSLTRGVLILLQKADSACNLVEPIADGVTL